MAAPRLIMTLRVTDIRPEPGDVRVITLRHVSKPRLPGYSAGAHVELHLPDGKRRAYSLMGDPADPSHYRIAVKREPNGRGGSRWLHENLAVGDTLPVGAPRNHFELAQASAQLLLAGGIGVTPLLAIARALQAAGHPYHLHFFSRSRAQTPLLDEIGQVLAAEAVTCHFDDEPDTAVELASLLAARREGEHLSYCGPPGFMAAVARASAHWPEAAVHFEGFAPPLDEDFVPEPFELLIASSGLRLPVPAQDSALTVLRAAGIDIASSCENGVCGTCECGYLAGEPLHRDGVLRPEARRQRFIPCISRAKGVLTLDL